MYIYILKQVSILYSPLRPLFFQAIAYDSGLLHLLYYFEYIYLHALNNILILYSYVFCKIMLFTMSFYLYCITFNYISNHNHISLY